MPSFHFVQHGLFEAGRTFGITDLAADGDELLVRQIGRVGSVFQMIVHGESPHPCEGQCRMKVTQAQLSEKF